MADFYELTVKDNYFPPAQRSFIHISIIEYDKAIELLEQAYEEHSWFLIFIQIEYWYDPMRNDNRFIEIMNMMNFKKKYKIRIRTYNYSISVMEL